MQQSDEQPPTPKGRGSRSRIDLTGPEQVSAVVAAFLMGVSFNETFTAAGFPLVSTLTFSGSFLVLLVTFFIASLRR